MEDAQRKRRAPFTYGKLVSNRRRISEFSEFTSAVQSSAACPRESDVSMGGVSHLAGSDVDDIPPPTKRILPLPSSKRSVKLQPQTNKTEPTTNGKPRAQKANTRSTGEAKNDNGEKSGMTIFDVPSSDEESIPAARVPSRVLQNPRTVKNKKELKSLKGKESIHSAQTLSTNTEIGSQKAAISNGGTISRPLPSSIPTNESDKDSSSRQSANMSKARQVSQAQATSHKDKEYRLVPLKLTEASNIATRTQEKPTKPPRRFTRASSAQAEDLAKISVEIPVLSIRRERGKAEKTEKVIPALKKMGAQPVSEDVLLPKAKTSEGKRTQKQKKSQPTTPSIEVESLYISSPPAPMKTARQNSTSIWDQVLEEESEPDSQSLARKPSLKRSREIDSSPHGPQREGTPPRRRRLIDTLEVDGAVRKSQRTGAADWMDVDSELSDNELAPHSQPLSQVLVGSQSQTEIPEPEDSSPVLHFGSQAVPNPPPLKPRNSRITYARQRSFLTEEVKPDGDPFADPLLLPEFGTRYHKKQEIEEIEDSEGPGMMKSLHELREAGVNKRFLDNVEGYFEDIEGSVSLSQKRAGYLELATKLRDKAFIHKFRANSFDRRLLTDFENQNDEVIRFSLCFITWCFLDEDKSSEIVQLVYNNGIIIMLESMLDSTRDIKAIAKDRKTNMSKAAQSLVADFCALVEASPVFGRVPKILSPQILAFAVLDTVMKGLRQAGWLNNCLTATMLRRLVNTLKPFVTSPLDKRKNLDLLLLELPISILESHSIGREPLPDTELSDDELKTLAHLLQGAIELEGEDLKAVHLLILRLNINLTNHRPRICDIFGEATVISTLVEITRAKFSTLSGLLDEEDRLIELDMLILGLALMINFAEMSDTARSAFTRDTSNLPQLDTLLSIFLARLERAAEVDSMEESQSNVGFGYLSILLGNLCQNTIVRNIVRSKMPKNSLEPLISAVEEFVAHNRRVDEERGAIMEGDDGDSLHKGFTERLEQVAVRLKSIEGLV